MSSIRERLSTAIRVFREDPDSVVTLTEDADSGTWTAQYNGSDFSGDTEQSALGSLYTSMMMVRDKAIREKLMEVFSRYNIRLNPEYRTPPEGNHDLNITCPKCKTEFSITDSGECHNCGAEYQTVVEFDE